MHWRKYLVVIVTLLAFSIPGWALDITEDIDGTNANLTTWGDQAGEDIVYISPDGGATTISVLNGVDLEIYPGVEVRFTGEYSLIIDGGATLTAEGTVSDSITFTSSTHIPGAWGQIIFEGDNAATRAVGNFQYCTVEYGGDPDSSSYPDGAAILAYGYATLRVENSTIRYCDGTGLGAHYVGNPNPDSVYFNHNQIYGCSQEFVHTIDEHVSSGLDTMPFSCFLPQFQIPVRLYACNFT